MKATILYTLLAFLLMFAAGCTKTDEPNNGGGNNGGDNGGGNNGGGTTPVMESVDLGLPSGTLWAACNVGADTPEGYGDYFAWGETSPKSTYNWTTYQHCNGNFNQLTKYCSNSELGYNGFVDNLTTLEPIDDAATANWGDEWRTPTHADWQELYDNTNGTLVTQNGVKGWLFTATNGNSLFLPAAGCRWGDQHLANGNYGEYWSSSFFDLYCAWYFSIDPASGSYLGNNDRFYGFSVRAVRSAK